MTDDTGKDQQSLDLEEQVVTAIYGNFNVRPGQYIIVYSKFGIFQVGPFRGNPKCLRTRWVHPEIGHPSSTHFEDSYLSSSDYIETFDSVERARERYAELVRERKAPTWREAAYLPKAAHSSTELQELGEFSEETIARQAKEIEHWKEQDRISTGQALELIEKVAEKDAEIERLSGKLAEAQEKLRKAWNETKAAEQLERSTRDVLRRFAIDYLEDVSELQRVAKATKRRVARRVDGLLRMLESRDEPKWEIARKKMDNIIQTPNTEEEN